MNVKMMHVKLFIFRCRRRHRCSFDFRFVEKVVFERRTNNSYTSTG